MVNRQKALLNALGVDDPNDPNADPSLPPPGELPAPVSDPTQQATDPGPRVEMPAAASDPAAPAAAPNYAFRNKVSQNFDMGKFDDTAHTTPKYQVARVLAGFDPSQGITPDVLAALNKLNLGTFSGSGDKVSLANGDPKWNGMTGADLIQDFGGQNNWALQGQFPGDAAAAGGGMPGGGGNAGLASAQSSLNGLLQGDPTARIQQAIAALMQGGNRPNLQALLGQLGGGV